jgi:hypothetical protein
MLRNYETIFHGCACCAMVCHEWRDGVPAMNPALALAAGAGAASCVGSVLLFVWLHFLAQRLFLVFIGSFCSLLLP